MATEVDIARLALSHIGDRANIASLTEASAQASHCNAFYPVARDTVLNAPHAWSFAKKRVALAALTNDLDSWDYKYQLPNDQIRLLAVLPDEAANDHEGVAFMVENDAIYTNEDQAVLRYVYRHTSTGLWPQPFVNAVARLLASYISGPIIKGTEGRKIGADQYKFYLLELAQAMTHDANASRDQRSYTPGSIQARGPATPEHLIESGQPRWR